MSIFKATIVGNIGKDPEMSASQAGKSILKFSVATSRKPRDGAEITTWVRVTLFGNDADFWIDKLAKGDKVLVIGNYEFATYNKNDGTLGFSHDISPWGVTVERLGPPKPPTAAAGYDDEELPF